MPEAAVAEVTTHHMVVELAAVELAREDQPMLLVEMELML
jgi:hypothetical protein